MSRSVMPTYARMPVSFVYGQGAWLFTADQHRYLDAISGIAVCSLGHAHPKIARALADQASKLIHTSNLYGIELQEQLASALTRLSGMDNAFFCNSGAEITDLRNSNAALALDGFQENGNDFRVIQCRQGVDVTKGNADEGVDQRLKAFLDLRVSGRTQGEECSAMKALIHDDDFGVGNSPQVAHFAGELECGFIGLSA